MRRFAVSLILGAVVAACTTSPTGRSQLQFFPEEQVAEMGASAFQQLKQQTPTVEDPALQQYVACVADDVTDALGGEYAQQQWDVAVFKDESANAFALPGGKIGVHTGLLDVAETPAQLATVLAHEVGHVIAEHGNERMSTAFATQAGLQVAQAIAGAAGAERQQLAMGLLGLGAQVGVILPFSRVQESEADEIGLELMAKAGYDPRAAVELWQNMASQGGGQPPEFLSTHPAHGTRIEDLQEDMDQALALYRQARAQGRLPDCGR